MTERICLGISTCPNDTFAFHGLMNGDVDLQGLEFDVELLDIQQLNDRLFRDEFDVAKTSFHAALHLADQTVVLPSGSALGYKVGPLLLAAKANTQPVSSDQTTLCPGEHTTATLLFQLFFPQTTSVKHVVFSDIMPALQQQTADFGVCIHEGRFTWQNEGLALVTDLGTCWEDATGCPLPLGGIVAQRRLASDTISKVQAVIQDSVQFGIANPDRTLPTMRRYAQEFDDDVLMKHVELYVNEWTVNLGDIGQRALDELSQRAKSIGLIAQDSPGLTVFSG